MNIKNKFKQTEVGVIPDDWEVKKFIMEEMTKDFLERHPTCALCEGNKTLEIHHKKPFHLHPELELDPNNLITLCESGKNGIVCHRAFGHLGSYQSINNSVIVDAAWWKDKIVNRP